eukprot:gene10723-biopygen3813
MHTMAPCQMLLIALTACVCGTRATPPTNSTSSMVCGVACNADDECTQFPCTCCDPRIEKCVKAARCHHNHHHKGKVHQMRGGGPPPDVSLPQPLQ